MKVFKGFLIALVGIFFIILIVTVFLPGNYYVERKIEIRAPASIIYYLLDDFRNWKYWDTWWKLDTNQIRIYAGPHFGLNSKFTWFSKDKNVGEGEIQIVDEKPFDFLKLQVRFGKEMVSFNQFRLMQMGDKILLSWSMEGELKFLAKWFRFFLDQAIGNDFEIGLKNLKNLAENIVQNKIIFLQDSFPETKIVFVRDSTSMNQQEIIAKYEKAFEEVSRFVEDNKLNVVGGPIEITQWYTNKGFAFDVCLPVENTDTLKPTGRIQFGTIPKMKVVRAVYLGPYEDFLDVYNKILNYLQERNLSPKGNFFEMYYTDPMNVSPAENVTIIHCPI